MHFKFNFSAFAGSLFITILFTILDNKNCSFNVYIMLIEVSRL